MSIDDPSVVEQVAELIADGVADYRFSREIAEALAEAGLLRPDPVWLDPEPVVPRPETKGTETEVEWGYVTREAWTSCGDDERKAQALSARNGGTVQSRTVTAWRNA